MFFHHRLPGRLLSPSGAASDVPSGLGFEASGLGWLGFLIIMLVYSNPNPILIITPRADPAPRLHSGGWRGGDDVLVFLLVFTGCFPFFRPQGEERGGEWGGG